APVVTRALGLEAAAVWSVGVKAFTLAQQLVYRIFDFSGGALAEMVVRDERARLKARLGDVIILTGSAAAAAGAGAALCNDSFVTILSHGQLSWAPLNNLLMAISLFVYSLTRIPFGFAGVTKQIGAMKYTYFFEGICFVVSGLLLAPRFGFPGIIVSGIVTNLLFSGLYGSHRMAHYFQMRFPDVCREWLKRPVFFFILAGAVAFGFWLATHSLNPKLQMIVAGGSCGLVLAALFWWLGLPDTLRAEALDRLG